MALLNPGAWQDTAWCSQAWQPDSWPEYGAAAPPVAPTEGDKWIGEAVIRRKPPLTLLLAAKKFFEAELGE